MRIEKLPLVDIGQQARTSLSADIFRTVRFRFLLYEIVIVIFLGFIICISRNVPLFRGLYMNSLVLVKGVTGTEVVTDEEVSTFYFRRRVFRGDVRTLLACSR